VFIILLTKQISNWTKKTKKKIVILTLLLKANYQFGDRAEDESIIDTYKKLVVEVYNVVMDGVINIFEKQFLSNSKIYADLSFRISKQL